MAESLLQSFVTLSVVVNKKIIEPFVSDIEISDSMQAENTHMQQVDHRQARNHTLEPDRRQKEKVENPHELTPNQNKLRGNVKLSFLNVT